MNYTFSSPLKAIQGTAIKDLTDGRFGPPKIARSRTPRGRPSSLSYASSFSSSKPHAQKLLHVLLPAKPKYIPNQRPPPEVHSSLPDGASGQSKRSRKVIITRFLLADGNISFAVGNQIDGVITPDAEEVPVAKILEHVSPAELERYENQDFFDEDERERILPQPKPRGRPRKLNEIAPSFNIAPIGEEQSLLLEGSIPFKKRAGRPKGALNKKGRKVTSIAPSIRSKLQIGRPTTSNKRGPPRKKANILTSTKPSVLLESSTAIKRPRGRPPRQKNLAVVIPSFNGPQPQELESSIGAESESDDMLGDPKPQYSMVVASGLGQSDTEDTTSRDQSVEPVPSSKRRRMDNRNAFVDLSSDADDDERSPHPIKRARMLLETSPDPIADDSAALLRQFQARVYGPDHSAKSSNIPHRESKPSLTVDDHTALLKQFQARTRSRSSSSDSLMGPVPRPLKPLPTQHTKSQPREASFPPPPPPKDHRLKVPASYLNNNITDSHPPRPQPEKATPIKPIPQSKFIQRRISLTPHFPPTTSFSHGPMDGSADSRPPSSISSASRFTPSQHTNRTTSQASRKRPSPSRKRALSPKAQSAPSQSSASSSTSKLGFAGLPQAKHITDYFTPKATVAKPTPTPIKTPHSPSLQLLVPDDSESEDQLARVSSSDSIGSEVIVVRRHSAPSVNRATTAEARPQASYKRPDPIDIDSSEDASSSSSEEESEHDGPTLVSNTAAPIQSTPDPIPHPKQLQRSAEAFNNAFEIEDDHDDGDSDSESDSESDSKSDSESDSLGSEGIIIRPG